MVAWVGNQEVAGLARRYLCVGTGALWARFLYDLSSRNPRPPSYGGATVLSPRGRCCIALRESNVQ
jgi:hypothetical protein